MATARSRRWVKLVAGLLVGAAVGPWGGSVVTAEPVTPLVQRSASAADLLLQAEQEINVGRYAEAAQCLDALGQMYGKLAPQDQLRYQQLMQSPRILVVRGAAGDSASAVQEQARQKIKQARLELADYKLDEADKLAREAESANATWGRNDDTPRKVLEEVARIKADGSVLLTGARHWLVRKDYERAEKLALAAEKVGTGWSLNPFADTPAKALKDIRTARGKTPPAPASGIQQVSASNKPPVSINPSQPPLQTREEAVALLRTGRSLLGNFKIEEALEIAKRLREAKSIRWGLFEDTPDALYRDASQARFHRDQEMAARLLTEARQLYIKGDLDGAEKAAQRAEQLHGPYSVFDFSERPTKVLADIETARLKQRPARPTQTAQRPPVPTTPVPTPTASNPATQCAALVAEARLALSQGDAAKAYHLAKQASDLQQRHNLTLADSPQVVLAEAQRAAGVKPPLQTVGGTQALPAQAADAIHKKQQAAALLGHARQLEKQGDWIGAHKKAQEARSLGAPFAPTEDSPDIALQQISARAAQGVASMVRQASEAMTSGGGNPVEIAVQAEATLTQARALAVAFGLDTQGVDAQLAIVLKAKGVQTPGTATVTSPAPATPPSGPGVMLLDTARTELRKGELSTARKAAEEAYRGPFGVQEEAVKILRSIDAEEAKQRGMAANRTFDAAKQAYQRGDYQHARTLLAAIPDSRQLDVGRQGHLREMMMTPQMSPQRPTPTVSPIPTTPTQGGTQQVRNDQQGDQPAIVKISDTPQPGILETTAAMREIKFQALRSDGLKAQSEATDRFRSGQVEQALEMLRAYLNVLNDSNLEMNQTTLLRRPVESRLKQFSIMKEQQELLARNNTVKENGHAKIGRQQLAEQEKQKKISDLMKSFNAAFKEGKYLEAERFAMQAHELDTDNPVLAAAMTLAKRHRRLDDVDAMKADKESLVYGTLLESERQGDPRMASEPIVYDTKRWAQAKLRGDKSMNKLGLKSLKEREIESKLNSPVTLNFKDVPLYAVLDDIRAYHGINIHEDKPALESKGISMDRPVTIKLENVSLKSCLNLLLKNVHLTYVIRDEVLQITTPEAARGKQETRTYLVTDLVIAVPNFGRLNSNDNPQPVQQPNNLAASTSGFIQGQGGFTPTPLGAPTSLLGGTDVGTPNGPAPAQGQHVRKSATQEEHLIKLITNTIEPKSWTDLGGPGTIQFFPLSNTLIVNQTTDIQEQIADLLQALRRLQDQEVAIELRFITITEDFYERIGVNFQMNIANPNGQRYAPQLLNSIGNNDPNAFNSFIPNHLVSGLNQAGQLTPDLSIPINNNSFFPAIPRFGGYAPGVGGINMGLAFLSDIQVFLFLEAVQGDLRNNVMQAPKITMFNGSLATLNIAQSQVNYITGVQLTQLGNGQVAFIPQTTPLPVQGQIINIQTVITADRRFVRMSLDTTLTNLIPGAIQTFPIALPLFPSPQSAFAGPSDPIILTQFLQQPAVTTVSVQTTVMVPDGGTVLLGGLKYLSESRSEYGPPLLGKIPGLDRLFRNVGYGRTTGSLLMMVTPRIIIQEEEEERATGFSSRPLIGTGGP